MATAQRNANNIDSIKIKVNVKVQENDIDTDSQSSCSVKSQVVASTAFADCDDTVRPLSNSGKFNHNYFLPLFTQQGKNDRVVMSRPLDNKVEVRNSAGTTQRVIQAASHNYAGLYGLDTELHHFALDKLPVVVSPDTQCLEEATQKAIAEHFGADFCLMTSTGYGSNMLAILAILNMDWLVILDEKSHNSLFVAVYQSQPQRIRKYRHNDMDHLHTILAESSPSFANILVATDGYSSMDGTIPDLAGLSDLKSRYGFTLLADEAHSFLSLGATGRGCVELWNQNNPTRPVDDGLIDIRTGTVSKAVGAVGGFVCGKKTFQNRVSQRDAEMMDAGYEPITVTACVQTLQALQQPTLVQRKLARLRSMAIFCRTYLQQSDIFVYGDLDSPIIPIFAGRPSSAARLSYELRKLGILATPVSTPAVPFWESRVRVCLSAAFDNETVCDLLRAVVKAASDLGLCRHPLFVTTCFRNSATVDAQRESEEAARSASRIRDLIIQSACRMKAERLNTETLAAGHAALDQYGLGSGGARWITGTTEMHLHAEHLIAKALRQPVAMTYADTYIGLTSTVAALCRPIIGYDHHELHVPRISPQGIDDGIRIAPKKDHPNVVRYDDINELIQKKREIKPSTYRTILLSSKHISRPSNVQALITTLDSGNRGANTTIMIIDEEGLGDTFSLHQHLRETQARLLIYGSFYRAFGLSGSYVAGDAALIEELRYTSRGYMFTTSQQPFNMAMIAAEVARWAGDHFL